MLIDCPECKLQVSSSALMCPHCGYLISPKNAKLIKNINKRKRLPNGFGQISEMKGHNLRNKYRAMVTVGKRPDGRPIVKPLKPKAYFATYNDAYAALVEYNRNPYDLNKSITVKELYEKWSSYYFSTLNADSSIRAITSAWMYCSSIYDMEVKDIRARHIKYCMDNGVAVFNDKESKPSANVKAKIKSIFNLMFDYALEYEIVDKNYARTFKLSNEITISKNKTAKGHIPFSEEEMKILWDNVGLVDYVDLILIQCYSGWRPQELGLIRLENVDLINWTFTGGMKTKSGINRRVPIHSRIKPLIIKRYNEAKAINSPYLINCINIDNASEIYNESMFLTYAKYKNRFYKIRDKLRLEQEHRAHDGRVHFVTMAKKYNVDEYAIKYIVGHNIQDITERIYTKRKDDWLRDEIEKIK